jgi:VanZ family protein
LLTPQRLVSLLRLGALVSGALLTALLLGPFQGLERHLGLSDTVAHAMAFYAVTVGLFAIAPHHRRTDLALAALAFGVVIELAQGLTGRSLSLLDLAWDAVGISAALLPGLVERLRHLVRVAPDQDFATLRAQDRRKMKEAQPSAETVARPSRRRVSAG